MMIQILSGGATLTMCEVAAYAEKADAFMPSE